MNEKWIKRWDENRIGFHQNETNYYLEKYQELLGSSSDYVFVPLCGKSLDLLYLAKYFKRVIGVEIVQKAIDDFILENNLSYKLKNIDNFSCYSIDNIDFYVGDIFNYTNNIDNKINIFDRASLVAIEPKARMKYAKKMLEILQGNMLLITIEYPKNEKKGPPFSVSENEVYELYGEYCNIKLLETINLNNTNDKLSKLSSSYEKVFLINAK